MANKSMFQSLVGKLVPPTNTVNGAGAPAYSLSAEQALAQYAATGCFNSTYYASAGDQLSAVTKLCAQVDALYLARLAVFCRERAFMKDMPALLLAVLSVRDAALFARVFERVVDNAKMLRTFVQIMRSGAVGRKSLGSRPKKLVIAWLNARSDDEVFRAAVGQDPSLADVIRLVHPKPLTAEREALYGYLLGRQVDESRLTSLVRQFEAFKKAPTAEVPDVPFQMLTSLNLSERQWTAIACQASRTTLRMNLNTFERHGVFKVGGMANHVARRLRSPDEIARAKVFPYQLFAAYVMSQNTAPPIVQSALREAMELSLKNVPRVNGKVFVLTDVSGSMSSPVTGYRAGATSAIRCIDVAGLIAAAFLRRNRDAELVPFAEAVKHVSLKPDASVLTNAATLAALGGGGTDCGAALKYLNDRKASGALVVYVSDNESWMDASHRRGTETMRQWEVFKQRSPNARLVCIDLQPNAHTQAMERADILNVGGFSDQVFEVIASFAKGESDQGRWVDVINRVAV